MIEASPSPVRTVWVPLVTTFVGGAALGLTAKFADESGIVGVGQIGSFLGVWVVVATLIAAWSHSRQIAALRVGVFMLAMVAAYYLATRWLFGVFPTSYFIHWAAVALLLSPLFAIIMWPSRQQGWLPAFAAALPVGLLLAEAFSFRLVLLLRVPPFVFDIGAAIVLFAVLPRSNTQRIRVFVLTPAAFIVASGLQHVVLPHFFGVLYKFGVRL